MKEEVVGHQRLRGGKEVLRTTADGEKKMENRRGLVDLSRRGGVGPGLGQVTGAASRGWITGNGTVEASSAASGLRFASTTPGRVGAADVRQGNSVHGVRLAPSCGLVPVPLALCMVGL